jgi:DMSO/TMAO reductase YedYZ heme-binding membrane subunit
LNTIKQDLFSHCDSNRSIRIGSVYAIEQTVALRRDRLTASWKFNVPNLYRRTEMTLGAILLIILLLLLIGAIPNWSYSRG